MRWPISSPPVSPPTRPWSPEPCRPSWRTPRPPPATCSRRSRACSGKERLVVGFRHLLGRGPAEAEDLRRAIAATGADALLVDVNAYGASVAALGSGLPWATTRPSLLPLPGAGIPPYGLGLAPMGGPLGWIRDRVLWALVERLYSRAMLPGLNALRTAEGLPPIATPIDHVLSPDRILVLTGEPLEYPRADLPAHVRFVGAQSWDPARAGPGLARRVRRSLAVARGVPVVAVPFGRDQPEVARRVVQAGAGVALSSRRLTAERLRRAVRDAIALRPGAEAAAARLRAAGGPAAFARAAEELTARRGGEPVLAGAQDGASAPVR